MAADANFLFGQSKRRRGEDDHDRQPGSLSGCCRAPRAGGGHQPQCNATTSLGINPRTLRTSLYDVLLDGRPLQDVLTLTEWINLDLVPSSTDLAGADVELAGVLARERLLARALAPVSAKYDYILIDEPPSLGLLTINGLRLPPMA